MSEMTPREIVHELDRHIIGQQGAKRAVAIALRNRWRRMQLPQELRQEVTPKNIVESIEKELNWGAEKLRDDITCMAININNTELIKKK